MSTISAKQQTLTIDEIIDHYLSIINIRPRVLFSHFLVEGYKITALNTIDPQWAKRSLDAKIMLGMLITLLDDLADNPRYFNPELLRILYQIGGQYPQFKKRFFSAHELKIIKLTEFLIMNIKKTLFSLPNYNSLYKIFLFDIWQIYLSNRYSELMTAFPAVRNLTEAKLYGPYNMGMVAAGMIDLMASSSAMIDELGKCREIFLLGQRLGRIGNLIATYEREKNEKDLTNEIFIYNNATIHSHNNYREILKKEHDVGIENIFHQANSIKSFNTQLYSIGLEKLFSLHQSMTGTI